MNWLADVVAHLVAAKAAGEDFYTAWNQALREYPPRARDLGGWRPTLIPMPGDEESVVECFQRACYDAWHGLSPGLRHFTVEMLAAEPSERPVARGRPQKMLAA